MNEWSLDVKNKTGVQTTHRPLLGDEYTKLATPGTAQHARVSVSYTSGIDYGAEKVTATVTLNCDQTEPVINRAGELAFVKAVELVTDAWHVLQKDRKPG